MASLILYLGHSIDISARISELAKAHTNYHNYTINFCDFEIIKQMYRLFEMSIAPYMYIYRQGSV